MREIGLEEALDRARQWHRAGGRWHFHVLPAGCRFNDRPGCCTLLLEGPAEDEILAVYAEDDLVQASQELVQWLHGREILDREQARTTSNEAQIQAILRRAAELARRGVRWHHHMLFPDCVLNRHPGRWNLVFEDPETGQDIEVLYDEEPVADLRRIEVAYFEQGPAGREV
ncbi:MAG: hypothetical protein GX597_18380 [Anaerolineaceae bacterium]|nr:hypothetical protein [Anaerolineaceae bacterium]